MMRALLSLILVFGVAGATSVPAVAAADTDAASASAPVGDPAANPYSATVPVAGTGDAQRNAAIASALSQVLQRVSPGAVPGSDALAQASGYVRDFRYKRAAGGGLELQVDFDPGAVGRLVAASRATVAGGTTPVAGSTAASPAQRGSGALWVDGIDSSHAFASLLSTLRADTALHDVTPVGAEGGGVLLRLDFDQPLATVLVGLTGPGGHLVIDSQPHAGADVALRWVP